MFEGTQRHKKISTFGYLEGWGHDSPGPCEGWTYGSLW